MLETAIQCTPNLALLAESDAPLARDISAVADLVLSRRAEDKNFGVVVIADAFLAKVSGSRSNQLPVLKPIA